MYLVLPNFAGDSVVTRKTKRPDGFVPFLSLEKQSHLLGDATKSFT